MISNRITQIITANFLIVISFSTFWSCSEDDQPDSNALISDQIILQNGSENDLRLFIDGLLTSQEHGTREVNDNFELVESTDFSLSGNYSYGSNNEIIAFQRDRAPVIVSNVPWTDKTDSVTLEMHDPVVLQLSFWVVAEPFNEIKKDIEEVVRINNQVFKNTMAGIQLSIKGIHDRTGVEDRAFHANWDFSKGGVDQSRSIVGSDNTSINVYYVDRIFFRNRARLGVWIPRNSFIGIVRFAPPVLLAHELGHSFGLGHSDRFGLSTTNAMISGSFNQDDIFGFTAGQIIRMHFSPGSIIQGLNLRDNENRFICSESLTATEECMSIAASVYGN